MGTISGGSGVHGDFNPVNEPPKGGKPISAEFPKSSDVKAEQKNPNIKALKEFTPLPGVGEKGYPALAPLALMEGDAKAAAVKYVQATATGHTMADLVTGTLVALLSDLKK